MEFSCSRSLTDEWFKHKSSISPRRINLLSLLLKKNQKVSDLLPIGKRVTLDVLRTELVIKLWMCSLWRKHKFEDKSDLSFSATKTLLTNNNVINPTNCYRSVCRHYTVLSKPSWVHSKVKCTILQSRTVYSWID